MITEILGMLLHPFFIMFLILLLLIFLLKISVIGITSSIKKLEIFVKSTTSYTILKKIENPLVYLFVVLCIMYFVSLSSFQETYSYIDNILFTILIIIITRIVSVVYALAISMWGDAFAEKHKDLINSQLLYLFTRTGSLLFYGIAVIYILIVWEIEILPIIGSLGIAGIAIAFALQETLKNFFGGIQLVLDRNVAKGDIVELSNGTSGTVYDISLRSTKIKTWDNRMMIVPNGVLANDIVTNITQPDRSRRISIDFGVSYGTDPDFVKHIVLEEIHSIEIAEKESPPPRVIFRSMGDSALLFEAMFWINDLSHFLKAREEGTIKIYERLNKEKIVIPFPQRTVWFNDEQKMKSVPYKKKKLLQKTIKKTSKKKITLLSKKKSLSSKATKKVSRRKK